MQELVTHFLAEALSRGVADAGVDPRRGQPDDRPAPGRDRTDASRATPSSPSPTSWSRPRRPGLNLHTAVGQRTLRRLVGAFYQPTIVLDPLVTAARREQLRGSVDPIKYSVRTGERIVRAGEPVTEEAHAKLVDPAGGASPTGQRGARRPERCGRVALQCPGPERLLAADRFLPAGELRRTCGRWFSSARSLPWWYC